MVNPEKQKVRAQKRKLDQISRAVRTQINERMRNYVEGLNNYIEDAGIFLCPYCQVGTLEITADTGIAVAFTCDKCKQTVEIPSEHIWDPDLIEEDLINLAYSTVISDFAGINVSFDNEESLEDILTQAEDIIPKDGKYLCPKCDKWTLEPTKTNSQEVSLHCRSCGIEIQMSRDLWDNPQDRLMALAQATKFPYSKS